MPSLILYSEILVSYKLINIALNSMDQFARKYFSSIKIYQDLFTMTLTQQ